LQQKAEAFFGLPDNIKLKYRKSDAVEVFHGYTPADGEV
jgi:hypothetical protein